MSELPPYVTVRSSGFRESADPGVLRTEMERGPPKERVQNSRAMVTLHVSLLFMTSEDSESFLDWYFDVIGRIGYFTMLHPRTGQLITVRFPSGDIGELQSLTGTDHLWQRDLAVEYMR